MPQVDGQKHYLTRTGDRALESACLWHILVLTERRCKLLHRDEHAAWGGCFC